MSRCWIAWLFLGVAAAQQAPALKEPQKPPQEEQLPLPPEEDKAVVPQDYKFNPVRSKREMDVGDFYFKKGDYKAAAGRYTEATRWNDGNADAWLRLGNAEEKMNDVKATRQAWEKYLQLAANAKNAPEIRKKLAKLKSD